MKAKKLLLLSLLFITETLSAQNYQVPVSEQDEPMMQGKFQPTWESLANYKIPEWFRNVMFGIWAHWGPQCVEGSGDWMARSLYMENSPEYRHHIANYGHPLNLALKILFRYGRLKNGTPISWLHFIKT